MLQHDQEVVSLVRKRTLGEHEILLVAGEALAMPTTFADVFMDVIGTLHVDLGFSLEHALEITKRFVEKGGWPELLVQLCNLRGKVMKRNKAYMKRRAQKYEDQGLYRFCVVCHDECKSHCNYCKQAGVKTYVCDTCLQQVKGTCHPWLVCGIVLKGRPMYCRKLRLL